MSCTTKNKSVVVYNVANTNYPRQSPRCSRLYQVGFKRRNCQLVYYKRRSILTKTLGERLQGNKHPTPGALPAAAAPAPNLLQMISLVRLLFQSQPTPFLLKTQNCQFSGVLTIRTYPKFALIFATRTNRATFNTSNEGLTPPAPVDQPAPGLSSKALNGWKLSWGPCILLSAAGNTKIATHPCPCRIWPVAKIDRCNCALLM